MRSKTPNSLPIRAPRADTSTMVVPLPKPTPRFGVLPTRTERDKTTYSRKTKHRKAER